MAEGFDPYLQWLGIRDPRRPPNHYALLGLALFEDDPEVISHAADRQMTHVRTFQTGRHGAESQRILNEIAAAKLCLLNPAKKQRYDAALRNELAAAAMARTAQTFAPVATPVAVPSAPPPPPPGGGPPPLSTNAATNATTFPWAEPVAAKPIAIAVEGGAPPRGTPISTVLIIVLTIVVLLLLGLIAALSVEPTLRQTMVSWLRGEVPTANNSADVPNDHRGATGDTAEPATADATATTKTRPAESPLKKRPGASSQQGLPSQSNSPSKSSRPSESPTSPPRSNGRKDETKPDQSPSSGEASSSSQPKDSHQASEPVGVSEDPSMPSDPSKPQRPQATDQPEPDPAIPLGPHDGTSSAGSDAASGASSGNPPAIDPSPPSETKEPLQMPKSGSDLGGARNGASRVSPSEQRERPDPRRRVPAGAEYDEAVKTIRELFAGSYVLPITNPKRKSLPDELLRRARQENADSVARYALLVEAYEQAIEVGDARTFEVAVQEVARGYQVSWPSLIQSGVSRAVKRTRDAAVARDYVRLAIRMAERAAEENLLDDAVALATVGRDLARELALRTKDTKDGKRDTETVREAVAVMKDVEQRRDQWVEFQKAQSRLAEQPDDAESLRIIGRYYCLVRNDWRRGIEALARADAVVAGLAQVEMQSSSNPLLCADQWFEAAAAAELSLKPLFQARALHWYTRAVDGLTGLQRVRVEARIKELKEAKAKAN